MRVVLPVQIGADYFLEIQKFGSVVRAAADLRAFWWHRKLHGLHHIQSVIVEAASFP